MQDLRILDSLPGKLRESITKNRSSVHLLSEPILLTVGCIPDIICPNEKDIDGNVVSDWPTVC
jgi:hypothetical protein